MSDRVENFEVPEENEIEWQLGHIYSFKYQGLLLYIGSTFNMHTRMMNHQSACFNPNSKKYNYKIYKYIRDNNILWDEIVKKVIHTRPFESKRHMEYWEQRFIEVFHPLCNKIKAYTEMSNKRIYMKQYMKQYREENKEKLKQYNAKHDAIRSATIVHCPCGKTYKGLQHKAHHERSQYHKSHI